MKNNLLSNKIKSHLVAIVPITLFDPKTTSELRFARHFRYSIVIEFGLGILSLWFYFAQHSQTCSFCIFTKHIQSSSAPLITVYNINKKMSECYAFMALPWSKFTCPNGCYMIMTTKSYTAISNLYCKDIIMLNVITFNIF